MFLYGFNWHQNNCSINFRIFNKRMAKKQITISGKNSASTFYKAYNEVQFQQVLDITHQHLVKLRQSTDQISFQNNIYFDQA